MNKTEHLLTPDLIWRPFAFDRVAVIESNQHVASLIRPLYAHYRGGPNIFEFANLCARTLGRNGKFSWGDARYIGFGKATA